MSKTSNDQSVLECLFRDNPETVASLGRRLIQNPGMINAQVNLAVFDLG